MVLVQTAFSLLRTFLFVPHLENAQGARGSPSVETGYTHSDFPMIFNQVNLGICPPLWEDNLPQVALEMISHGIPILTSTNGGAQELNNHPDFKYINNLEDSILHIMQNRSLLESYWEYANKLTTMEKHLDNLIKIWTNS